MQRQRRWSLAVVALVGVGVLILGIAQAASASLDAAQGGGARCSLATQNGTYLASVSGTQLVQSTPVPFAYAYQTKYDGKGGGSGVVTISFNGTITRNFPYNVTYTINPDCSGTETDAGVGSSATADFFVEPDGSRSFFVQTDPGSIMSSVQYKVSGNTGGH